MIETETLIIGAGLSGISLGRILLDHQKHFFILEKSRGLGGRIATRRINEQSFDHGALYISHDSQLLNVLSRSELKSSLRLSDEGIYTAGGMTRITKSLAANLPIKKEIRAEKITKDDDSWKVQTDTGELFRCRNLVITAPLPQAIELLEQSSILVSQELRSITYSKGLLGLINSEDSLAPEVKSAHVTSVIPMASREFKHNGYVIRMSPDWSHEYFDRNEDLVLEKIRQEFNASFKTPPKITYIELKKWRYVTPEHTLPDPYLEIAPSLFLIGDSFGFPNTRGALLSARTLAEKLI